MVRTPFLLVLLVSCTAAHAQLWTEVGNAPPLPPGQLTMGVGQLTRIDGTLFNADFDPDIYCIQITDPANFSATTVGSAVGNLSLWLFDSNFNGVAHDGADDGPAGPNAGYQASLTNSFVPGAGVYFLGISRGGIDALSGGGEIWMDTPTIEMSPNGLGAPGPITGWTFPGYGLNGAYSIGLTGTEYHGVPEPSTTLALFVLTLGVITRRRGSRTKCCSAIKSHHPSTNTAAN